MIQPKTINRFNSTLKRANLLARCYLHQSSLNTHHHSNDLLKILNQRILSSGPISIPIYTNLCLNHPQFGYYSRKDRLNESDPFGKTGDFITSPEISQIFGELIAIWFVSRWQNIGCPSRARIIELGPGRGTLMADIIRTFQSIKSFKDVLQSVHLIENSQFMRERQKQKLRLDESKQKVFWYDRIEQIPSAVDEWTMIIAHEFFDALPVHIFQKTEMGFREVMVDIDDQRTVLPNFNPLRFVLSPRPTLASQALITDDHKKLPSGTKLELSPSSTQIAQQLAKIIQPQFSSSPGGTGLIIDYGAEHYFGHSLRGFYRHQTVDPLSNPGLTDITANVDFAALKRAIELHAATFGTISQRQFLLSMGIEVRTSQLKQSPDASERLIASFGMGEQYKFLAFESRMNAGQEEKVVYPFNSPVIGNR
ncbi:hypothetical protein O181_005652 [Austropuccinia psidii MF-1]|uniref:Protein arginine methyltransferase NDUFAF7 n=1 Tax=Austropuccinia psidii MF-1 TaxID=1389203 RepID=A0A9Q3BII0_9BASI|nr:hypothetical protein [Austropuccinia psidii MF-1]